MTAPQKIAAHGGLRRVCRAGAQVLLLVVLVPLGIVMGWFVFAPTPEALAAHAADGADAAALLELVQRAEYQPEAEAQLQCLLLRDAGALNALASLAAGHEEALLYLISLARTQPNLMPALADLEMSYPYALRMLQHMVPVGIDVLAKQAESKANACFMLGVAYENGCHVKQDWGKSAHWYGKACDMGYPPAKARYAFAAYEAALAEASPQAAFNLFRKSAEAGHAAAQCALGVCYAAGDGVEVDLQQALHWYERSAAQGFRDAQFNLGWCYQQGEGVPLDMSRAAEWFRKAALQGDDMAQYYLGRAYELGEGVPLNYAEALRWYQWAVEQGNDAAQCALGHCYAQGRGVQQSWHRAVYWYKLSAARGRNEAQLALAYCYEHGYGVPRDASAACHWRRCAHQKTQSNPNQS